MLVCMESQPSKDRNRVVLVTGGAIRMGAAIAEELAKSGWNVVVHANRSHAEAEALCARLRLHGVRAWAVTADLAYSHAAEKVIADTLKLTDRLDALVNNAAVFSLKSEMSALEREQLLGVNFHQPVQLAHSLFSHLQARQARGSVVNLLDQRIAKLLMASGQRFNVSRLTFQIGDDAPEAVRIGDEVAMVTPYEESKLLLAQATVTDALALAPVLRVNAVAPGAILCPTGAAEKEPSGHFPLGVRPTPSQVASAVRWLLEAESVTGQTLYVDGGQHLV
jgi:NAD(P)-dependent dehydrogenase (short-subunit alcohol dehydrogenase family)